MILGGEITSKHIVLDVGSPTGVSHLQSMFTARNNYFLVPPYDERVDMRGDDNKATFFRFDGTELCYEDARFILNKLVLFQAMTSPKASEMLLLAQEILPCTSTLLFPDSKRAILEFVQYENWARLDFQSQQFRDVSEKVRADIANYLPPEIEIMANTTQEAIFRTKDGSRLLLSDANIKKIAGVLVSFGLLPPELHQRFILNVDQFSLMQVVRIYLHHTLHAIKDAETVGGIVHATYASDQALRVLRQLAEHGALEELSDNDTVFLSHITLFAPKEYNCFDGVHGLKEFMQLFIATYKTDIRALSHMRLKESMGEAYRNMQKDGMEIIEGSTSRLVEREEERRAIMEQYQKKLGS